METNVESENQQKNAVEEMAKNNGKRPYLESVNMTNVFANEDGFDLVEHSAPVDGEYRDDEPAPKYRQIDSIGLPFQLDQFSDEVLYEIFKSLDSWTLMALMNTCVRFHTLVQDRRFWNDIDSTQQPLPLGILEDVLERVHGETTSIKLRGPPAVHHVHGESKQFSKILASTFANRCVNLRVLELDGVPIDFGQLSVAKFKFGLLYNVVNIPNTLTRLIFNDCSVRIPNDMRIDLNNLEEFGIQNCEWMTPYDIWFESSCQIRWLSFKGCQNMTYFANYGATTFTQLEYLDLRLTPIHDYDLEKINLHTTLKELLLDCPEQYRAARSVRTNDDTPPASASGSTAAGIANSDGKISSSTKPNKAENILVEYINDDEPSTSAHALRLRAIACHEKVFETQSMFIAPTFSSSPSYTSPSSTSRQSTASFSPRLLEFLHYSQWIEDTQNHLMHDRYPVWSPKPGDVSDRGICCFGRPPKPVHQDIIWKLSSNRRTANRLERLSVRNYRLITDISLRHLVQCSPVLVYLDLSGTAVTIAGVNRFKSLKPDCVVVAEHLQTKKN